MKINNLDKSPLLLKCSTNLKCSLFVSRINDHKFNISKKVPETFNKSPIFMDKMKVSGFKDLCLLNNRTKIIRDLIG